MRSDLQKLTRTLHTLKTVAFIATLTAFTLLPMLASPDIAHATNCGITCTYSDPWGTQEVASSGWLTSIGGGVPIYSNGPLAPNGPSPDTYNYINNSHGTSTQTGIEWQCVELVNRLYITEGWITNTWTGNGNQLYSTAPSNLSKQLNGSVSNLAVGDVLSMSNGSGPGHAAVVNSISGSSITIASQNTNAVYDSTAFTINGGTISTTWSFYSVIGVIHHPVSGGGGTTGSPARSDVDNNGGADMFAMVTSPNGVIGYSMLSTYQSFLAPQQWWNGTGLGWSGVTPLVGDVNGDKKADLVFLTNEGTNGTKAYVALSNGTSFGTPQLWYNMTGLMYSGIKPSLGDVDGNGCEDLVLTTDESNGSKAYVLPSTCQGFLAPQQWWDGTGYGWSGITPMVSDTNGDKKADYMFITDEGTNGTKAFVATSNGSTGFNTAQLWQSMTGLMYSGIKVTAGDADGNGCSDFVLTTDESTGSKAFVMLSTCQSFFAPQKWWDGTGLSWSGVTPFTGDVNGDKKADFVYMTNEGANGAKFFAATSNGSAFTAPQLWLSATYWGYSGIKAYLK